jgi:hypothetical protein
MTADYMRGVCVDCTNKPPTLRKLKNAAMNSIRIEMRDLPSFYTYTQALARNQIEQTWLVGPSTGPLEPILDKTTVRPSLVIIGNEPDVASGGSSWSMSKDEYIHLWAQTAILIRQQWPAMELATAGMYNPAYLWGVHRWLRPQPTYVNRHYPDSVYDIRRFDEIGQRTIVGEWCWRNATKQEMYDWENMLEYYTWASFWFCWADYMVPDMGLVTATGKTTRAYRYLKEALTR